ncbi:uncharacterized protein LOC123905440 [Trifolium pratense]|uniref:uncharacterized protein LOC123905440 n=1 Tax=Trifolium pratense TaxID=57577 RepID=UPI001E693551|nr:uncharacterized protein LOC123905440 [Trifolium pratense]
MPYPAAHYNGFGNGFGASSSRFNPYLPRYPSPMRPSSSQATNAVLLHGTVGSDGLYKYKFPSLNIQPAQSVPDLFSNNKPTVCTIHNSTSTSNSMHPLPSCSTYLWHLRLGHPNEHILKLVLKNCNLSFSNTNKDALNF